jgi:hypothetical protein
MTDLQQEWAHKIAAWRESGLSIAGTRPNLLSSKERRLLCLKSSCRG